MIPDFLKTGSNNNNAKFSNPCTILLISFSLLTESPQGKRHLLVTAAWRESVKTSSHVKGRPGGAGTGKHRFPLRCPGPMFIAEQMAQEQRRHKQFSPPPAPSEETMPPLPTRTGTVCPSLSLCSPRSPPPAEFPGEAGPVLVGHWGRQGPGATLPGLCPGWR